jgi:uncharacterized protein DUF4236
MGFRFRKSVKIAPGVRLRASGRSVSVGTTGRRARASASRRGVGMSVTLLPGLSWFARLGGRRRR